MVPQQNSMSNSLVPVTQNNSSAALAIPQKKAPSMAKPKWHAPWKLYRVISGHLGWVRCCAVEPGNEWFATGSADRVIKVLIFRSFIFFSVFYLILISIEFLKNFISTNKILVFFLSKS